jgi:transposase
MNIHKNARLTLARRLEIIRAVKQGLKLATAAAAYGVSVPTVRKWVARYVAEREAGLRDRSSLPVVMPRALDVHRQAAIVELRRRRLIQARIARTVGVSAATLSRVLAGAGLSRVA